MSFGSARTRREFLRSGLGAALGLPVLRLEAAQAFPLGRAASASRMPSLSLPDRFRDLARHFIFEYYPWYHDDPWRHWDSHGRVPPLDIASNHVPWLGPYSSLSKATLESHARWLADSGAGAVNVSWWGRGSFEDRAVPLLMDVMRDHGLKVTFHLEPYAEGHGRAYADDVIYLLREHGDKRRWDAFLILENEDGSQGPVLKSFRTILPPEERDCLGNVRPVADFTPDDEWRRQTDGLRHALRHDFHHLTLLADSLDCKRVRSGGFDGVAVYDNYVRPDSYAAWAEGCSAEGLVLSFNCNPGFDAVVRRDAGSDPCYHPPPFEPPAGPLDFTRPEDRERAAALAQQRIADSLAATIQVQTDPALANVARGFFLVYINSFNEWHEGHALEPMKDAAALRPEEKALGYHNPEHGGHRLETLKALLGEVLAPATAGASPPGQAASARPAVARLLESEVPPAEGPRGSTEWSWTTSSSPARASTT